MSTLLTSKSRDGICTKNIGRQKHYQFATEIYHVSGASLVVDKVAMRILKRALANSGGFYTYNVYKQMMDLDLYSQEMNEIERQAFIDTCTVPLYYRNLSPNTKPSGEVTYTNIRAVAEHARKNIELTIVGVGEFNVQVLSEQPLVGNFTIRVCADQKYLANEAIYEVQGCQQCMDGRYLSLLRLLAQTSPNALREIVIAESSAGENKVAENYAYMSQALSTIAERKTAWVPIFLSNQGGALKSSFILRTEGNARSLDLLSVKSEFIGHEILTNDIIKELCIKRTAVVYYFKCGNSYISACREQLIANGQMNEFLALAQKNDGIRICMTYWNKIDAESLKDGSSQSQRTRAVNKVLDRLYAVLYIRPIQDPSILNVKSSNSCDTTNIVKQYKCPPKSKISLVEGNLKEKRSQTRFRVNTNVRKGLKFVGTNYRVIDISRCGLRLKNDGQGLVIGQVVKLRFYELDESLEHTYRVKSVTKDFVRLSSHYPINIDLLRKQLTLVPLIGYSVSAQIYALLYHMFVSKLPSTFVFISRRGKPLAVVSSLAPNLSLQRLLKADGGNVNATNLVALAGENEPTPFMKDFIKLPSDKCDYISCSRSERLFASQMPNAVFKFQTFANRHGLVELVMKPTYVDDFTNLQQIENKAFQASFNTFMKLNVGIAELTVLI